MLPLTWTPVTFPSGTKVPAVTPAWMRALVTKQCPESGLLPSLSGLVSLMLSYSERLGFLVFKNNSKTI